MAKLVVRKLLPLILLLSSLAMAQSNAALVGSVEGASQALRGQLDSGAAEATWTGMGLVSGDMLDMELTNKGGSPQRFEFVPGMVLEDPGGQAQPIMLDESLSFTLQPGESVKKRMRGYCLDSTKQPPAANTSEDYQMKLELDELRDVIAVLYSSIRLDRASKLKPVLRPRIHRTITTQRAVWATLGGPNPDSKEDLREDIEKEIRLNTSALFPQGQMDCLSQRLWSDVQSIMAEAQGNQ